MKIYDILLTAALISINAVIWIDGPAAAQAPVQHHASPIKKLLKKPPVYNMVERSVVGADNVSSETVWEVQLATMIPSQINVKPQPPGASFKSLDAPALLKWVGTLPPRSEIAFDIFTGPRIKFADPSSPESGNPPTKLQQEIKAFGRFCAKHNVSVIEDISSG